MAETSDVSTYPEDRWATPDDITKLDMVFGADALDHMPAYDDIPEEFRRHGNKWVQFQADWFYSGLKDVKAVPKEGVDPAKAWAHLKMINGSWEPKHEHKEAAVAYLASLWFKDVKYKLAK